MNKQIRKLEKVAETARAAFLRYNGVLGVGYGYKRSGGQVTDALAVVVWVEKKLPREKLSPEQVIPPRYAGYPTDVEVVRFSSDSDEADPSGLSEGRQVAEFLDWGKIHRLNVKQKRGGRGPYRKGGTTPGGGSTPEFDSPIVEVRDDLFIIEDDASLFYVTAEDEKIFDYVGAWGYFRAEFGDDYDFVTFYFDDSDEDLPKPDRNHYVTIYRDPGDAGYGRSAADNRGDWETSSRLLGFASYRNFTRRTLLHEIGHHWLFTVNYADTPGGAERTHLHEGWIWSPEQQWVHPGTWPDTDRSPMFYGYYDWVEDESNPGVFHQVPAYSTDPDDDTNYKFSPLDQYLMGFLHKQAVASSPVAPPEYPVSGGDYQIICVDVPNGMANPGDFEPHPLRTITADDIIANEGERTPTHLESQRVFHQAVIAITYNRTASSDFLNRAEQRRQIQADNWRRATDGRSVTDTSLLRPNEADLYVRDNTADPGEGSSSGAFWDSPDILVRNCDEPADNFLDPNIPNDTLHQTPLASQDNWVYARIHNRSAEPYQNVRVNVYIANFHGFSGRDTIAEAIPRTEVIYPVDWHPDSLIGSELLDEVPAGGTAVAKVCWSQQDVPSDDWHPCLLVEIIPLGTDPSGLHHVWDNKKLAQKNITIDYVHGPICPNPHPPAPYRYYLPFSFGHALTTSRSARLELERNLDDPHLAVYLDPAGALGTLYRAGDALYHLLPALRDDAATQATPKLHDLALKAADSGLVVEIPAGTELGVQCGSCETPAPGGLWVKFCDDTRLLLSSKTPDYSQLGLVPLAGFEYETIDGKPMLKMVDPHRATFPVSLVERKEYQMGLLLKGYDKTVDTTVRVRIKHWDEHGRLVGGIDLEARPCESREPEPIVY